MKHKKRAETEKEAIFGMIRKDINSENFLEGAIIRPAVLMLSFAAFIAAMFLLLVGNLKWGGSLIILSFVLNMYAIYESLTDEASIFRTLNIAFKLMLFLAEVAAFNWVLVNFL